MGIAGKVIGSVLGAIVGGPIGMLIGFGAGSLIDEVDSENSEENKIYLIFLTSLFSIAAKMAKADGVVTKEEIAYLEYLMKDVLQLNSEWRKYLIDVFHKAKEDNKSAEEYLTQISELLDYELREALIIVLIDIALADGKLTDGELNILLSAEKVLKFPSGYVEEKLEKKYSRLDNDNNPKLLKHCYEILEISESATNEEVAKAYRQKVKIYHPDKLPNNTKEEIITLVTEKFREIQRAYEVIKKNRGIK